MADELSVADTFQVNLRGIVDLLSHHLYSSPRVYVRELLQNAVDAIHARQLVEPDLVGEIRVTLTTDENGVRRISVRDNGIGLDESQVGEFLAIIGRTSKRDEFDLPRSDFLGQFGIGLLACFLVTDEISVVTRSVNTEQVVRWTGQSAGTHRTDLIDVDLPVGTTISLSARRGSEEWFDADNVTSLLRLFGEMLPHTISLVNGDNVVVINRATTPWHAVTNAGSELLAQGEQLFQTEFLDAVPLEDKSTGSVGVAYVLPFAPNPASRQSHRLYLKRMLLSEAADDLLPEWAFFVRCVVNSDELRPTASREALYENNALEETRATFGEQLRAYIIGLAQHDRRALQRVLSVHELAMKSLAIHDDEFLEIIVDALDFETSLGAMTLIECANTYGVIRYVRNLDVFRQLSQVAGYQSMCVVNGGYVYGARLIERLAVVRPELRIELVEPTDLLSEMKPLSSTQESSAQGFLDIAAGVSNRFGTASALRTFTPSNMPTFYAIGESATLGRSFETARDLGSSFWAEVLDAVEVDSHTEPATLCFNYSNPIIRRLLQSGDESLVRRSVEVLYAQAVLLSRQPLRGGELGLLNESLLDLIDRSIVASMMKDLDD